MKYIAAILLGALIVGGLLTAVVYSLFGAEAGWFFAKFIAGPLGLFCAFLLFIIYDTLWPKSRDEP
ncbi:MAG: hypothetical protein KDJ27_19740 [Gammaproteobacteria bacterium]|nr:hypothetical protein [Gammaproteobacteria bacterium]MCB1925934.1 hypothetical protein [Gammaproteobacteria bacterium]